MHFDNLIKELEQLPANDFADYNIFDIIEKHGFDLDEQMVDDGVFDNSGLADFIEHGIIEGRRWELETIQDSALYYIKVGLIKEWDVFRYHELKDMISEDESRIEYLESHDGIYWFDYDSENDYKLTNQDIIDYLSNLKKLDLI